ncbi:hypothetical protein [Halalkalibacter lacteus]|uniref:hypothetical protein n=1 Tax=Halalkalibacter lacteus TaxID=3090663 RepID=UPI002FC8A555
MSREVITYIGSTPRHLTRAAKDLHLRELTRTNKELLETLRYSKKKTIQPQPFRSTKA